MDTRIKQAGELYSTFVLRQLLADNVNHSDAYTIAYVLKRNPMRRIERLEGGLLHVGEGQTKKGTEKSFYVESIDDSRIPPDIRKRFNLLSASDVGTVIKKVGRRVDENIFWVYE